MSFFGDSSAAERLALNQEGGGSNPPPRTVAVAQLVGRLTVTEVDAGSSPVGHLARQLQREVESTSQRRRRRFGTVAQQVERWCEVPQAPGSTPGCSTTDAEGAGSSWIGGESGIIRGFEPRVVGSSPARSAARASVTMWCLCMRDDLSRDGS